MYHSQLVVVVVARRNLLPQDDSRYILPRMFSSRDGIQIFFLRSRYENVVCGLYSLAPSLTFFRFFFVFGSLFSAMNYLTQDDSLNTLPRYSFPVTWKKKLLFQNCINYLIYETIFIAPGTCTWHSMFFFLNLNF